MRPSATQELNGSTVTANIWNGGTSYFQRTDSSGSVVPLVDALGSVLALADANGNLTTQYTYDPFGGTTASGTASANPFQYIGQENDLTGLYYLHARYYRPALHRFISEDPLGFGGGDVNLHAYGLNSPSNYRDPSGKSVPIACAIGGAGNVALNWVADKLTGRKITLANSADYFISGCKTGVIMEITGLNWVIGKVFSGVASAAGWAAGKLFTAEIEAAAQAEGKELAVELVEEGPQSVADILQAHVDRAVQQFEQAGFTPAQEAAIASNPELDAAYMGERIDFFAKQLAADDPILAQQGIKITPRGQFGPDFFNPTTGEWWDITTPNEWFGHVSKYTSFGSGTILVY